MQQSMQAGRKVLTVLLLQQDPQLLHLLPAAAH
jgi:hypothetical protein